MMIRESLSRAAFAEQQSLLENVQTSASSTRDIRNAALLSIVNLCKSVMLTANNSSEHKC